MAKQVKRASTKRPVKKSKTERLRSAPKPPQKRDFDPDALIFETALSDIEKGLALLSERFEGAWEGKTEPWDSHADYILAWWTLNLPEAKRRGVKTVLASARERRILGIYKGE